MADGPLLDLHPRQSLAFSTTATEVLYGGAAAAGKSHLLRSVAIAWCVMIPGLKVGLFRRLYPDLKANHLEGPGSFYVLLAPYINSGHVRIIKGEILFWNGSRINLHHCQHETDVIKYQGAEFHVLLFDELTHFTEYQYLYIRGRLRSSKGLKMPKHLRGLFPRVMAGANPGGLGHNWVKEMFVEKGEMVITQMPEEQGGMRRQFIPGKLADNPSITENDPGYASRLMGLGDPILVRALLEGDWDIAAGAMYAEIWRKPRHVIEPFPIPIDWDIWMGADDGFAAPASVHWLTQDPHTKRKIVIRELYAAKMLPEEMARKIKDISANIPRLVYGARGPKIVAHGPEPFRGLMDAAAFTDNGQTAEGGVRAVPRGNQLVKLGIKFKPCEKWDGSRVHRAQNLAVELSPAENDPDKVPRLRFFNCCPQAIKTIATIPRDAKKIEDVDTDFEDHAYDSVTYGLQYKRSFSGTIRTGV